MISQILRKKYPRKTIFLKLNHNKTKEILKTAKNNKIKLPENNYQNIPWIHTDNSLFFINIPHNTYIH